MDKIWWTQIPTALKYTEDIVNSLQEGKSVILELPQYLPWYETMRNLIQDKLDKCETGHVLKFLVDRNGQPGEIILQEYCKAERQADYRPGIGYAKFLAECKESVLNQRFVWVTGIDSIRIKEWIRLVGEYEKAIGKNGIGGVFILESKNENSINAKKGFQVLSFEKFMGFYDFFAFNILAASSIDAPMTVKQYLAESIVAVVGNDVELSSQCVGKKHYKKFLQNPYDELRAIMQEERRSDGTKFKLEIDEREVQHCIWIAQIKCVFPCIEEYREAFIHKYEELINRHLPIVNSFGEQCSMPNELEIGTLFYMADNRRLKIDEVEYERLRQFKSARNRLAHLETIEWEQVQEILCYKILDKKYRYNMSDGTI